MHCVRLALFLFLSVLLSCSSEMEPFTSTGNYRQDMRLLVQGISSYARQFNNKFIVIPQNGQELLTDTGTADGAAAEDYLAAINGQAREDLYYGYPKIDMASPDNFRTPILPLLWFAQSKDIEVLVIDYCSTPSKVDDSYAGNGAEDFLSFAANRRALDNIPGYPAAPYNVHSRNVFTLYDAENFLYLINPGQFASRQAFLDALKSSNHDIVVIDLYYGKTALTGGEIDSIRYKAGGGKRLVLAYMSIGEAEDYRYYWDGTWADSPPAWLEEENPDWPGNYKVRYWDGEWQKIIYGNDASYTKKIVDAGFDGVYLDIIDAYQYFEERD